MTTKITDRSYVSVTVVAMLIGAGVSWGIMSSASGNIEKRVSTIEINYKTDIDGIKTSLAEIKGYMEGRRDAKKSDTD